MSVIASTHVWKHSKQHGGALLVLLALADIANASGDCWPGIPYIAAYCRMSERNVQRIIGQLEIAGEIRVAKNSGVRTAYGFTNRYHIVMEAVVTGGVTGLVERGEAGVTPLVKQASPEPSTEPLFKSEPSEQPPTARAYEALRIGVVAQFPIPQVNCELPEKPHGLSVSDGAHDIDDQGDGKHAIQKTIAAADTSQTIPSSAPPLPQFHPIIRDFWPTCETEPALGALITERGDAWVLAVIRYVNGQKCTNRQGLGRALLARGFLPPGFPPGTMTEEDTRPDEIRFAPEPDESEIETAPDEEEDIDQTPAIDVDAPEFRAWQQLCEYWRIAEAATYETYLRNVALRQVERGAVTTLIFQADSEWVARNMQNRAMQAMLRRALADELKMQREQIALVFEAPAKAKVA